MPKRTEYKITGTTTVKPENLPEGLTVETTPARLIEKFPLFMSRTLTVQESSVHLDGAHFSLESASQAIKGHMNKETLVKLRDTLNELLGAITGLRKVTDKSGYFTEWFELSHDEFYNQPTFERAKAAKAEGSSAWTYNEIKESYGIRNTETV